MDNETRRAFDEIIHLGCEAISRYVPPPTSHQLIEEWRTRTYAILEREINRTQPQAAGMPDPRATPWEFAARAGRLVRDATIGRPHPSQARDRPPERAMTAEEVRRRQAEHARAVERRAMQDLAAYGVAAVEVRPGQVRAVGQMELENVEVGPAPQPEHLKPQAIAKAKGILWSYLNAEQRTQLFCLNYFRVRGSKTNKIYRIAAGHTGNVIREDGNTYCLVPDEPVPMWDQLLAQKLLIEDNEMSFIRKAHRQDGREAQDGGG